MTLGENVLPAVKIVSLSKAQNRFFRSLKLLSFHLIKQKSFLLLD